MAQEDGILPAQALTMLSRADFSRPAEKISYPQQCAVTATGLIWTRFSTVITPVRCFFSYTCHGSIPDDGIPKWEPLRALPMRALMQICSATLRHEPLRGIHQNISAGRR